MNSSPFQQAKPQQRPKNYTNDSILEALRDLGGGVGKTATKDVAGKVASDALASLFGAPIPKAGEMRPNQSVEMAPGTTQPQMRKPDVLSPDNVAREHAQVKQQIEGIRMELKALAQSVNSLNTEVQKAINEVPVNPGVYHLNFFERLQSVLKILREQVDDSRSWAALSSGRKQKKMGYWGMYKKHGTSFGLSNERSLATQAG